MFSPCRDTFGNTAPGAIVTRDVLIAADLVVVSAVDTDTDPVLQLGPHRGAINEAKVNLRNETGSKARGDGDAPLTIRTTRGSAANTKMVR